MINYPPEIAQAKIEKAALLEPLKAAYKIREKAYQAYQAVDTKWITIRQQYEALDRQIAMYEASLKPRRNTIRRPQKTDTQLTKEAARKALEALPKEIRDQLLKTFA